MNQGLLKILLGPRLELSKFLKRNSFCISPFSSLTPPVLLLFLLLSASFLLFIRIWEGGKDKMRLKLWLFFCICFCFQKVGLVLRAGDWRGCRRAAWLAPYCPAFPMQTLSSLPLKGFLWLCYWWLWVITGFKIRPEKDKQSNRILSCHVVFLSFHLTLQRFN